MNGNKESASENCVRINPTPADHLQPYGIFILADADSLTIVKSSSPLIPQHTVILPEAISLLGITDTNLFFKSLKEGIPKETVIFIEGAKEPYLGKFLLQGKYIYLELETETAPYESSFLHSNEALSGLTKITAVGDLLTYIAETVKELSGYGSVRILKFYSEKHSAIVAEDIEKESPSYLGAEFNTPTPAPAIEFLKKNLWYYIPDINYKPTPIRLPKDADKSLISFRGFSEENISQLKATQTASFFCIPLLSENKLWGLVSCSSSDQRAIPRKHREILRLFTGMAAAFLFNKEKLQESIISEKENYQLSIIARKTASPVFTVNSNCTVDYANPAFAHFTKFPFTKVIGKKLYELFPSIPEFQELSKLIETKKTGTKSFSKEVVLYKTSKEVYYNFHFTPVVNLKKQLEKVIGIGLDITPVKEYAKKLEEKNDDLDRFASIVSHDLKAPLRTMEGVFSLIEDDLKSKGGSNILLQTEMIKKSISRMNEMISGILTYAQSSKDLPIERLNINQLVEEILEAIKPPQHIEIVKEIYTETISIEKILLQQVLQNLISNAVKYHDKETDGFIKIKSEKPDKKHIFQISDNGPGIPQKFQKRIFDIFQTVPGRQAADSTGIGLAIVKKIIESKGGAIDLQSEDGQGTTFTITLPEK
ncbi:ATP-binding protein [Cytophagaceae bacterium ABcell3]|nr:ATP-binding protein [Cytophagaceae bacterium ABcell3]